MAEDQEKNEESGLGNLPPLSDFDSQASDFDSGGGGEFYSQGEISSDSGLPPLGQGEISSDSGLSPLSDFDSDKQEEGTDDPFADLGSPGASAKAEDDPFAFSPEGGAAQTEDLIPSSDFDTPMFESDFGGDDEDDEDDGFGAAASPAASAGGGFGGSEDPFAVANFDAPVPPGPDSGIDTPLTDSAFGGDAPAFGTPAPTQAMQTPMFGDGGGMFGGMQAPSAQPAGGGGMDFGDFGGGGGAPAAGGMDLAGMGGTPPPDFSPDTGMEGMTPMGMEPVAVGGGKKKGGGTSPIIVLVAAVIALVIGIAVGPRVPLSMLNPALQEKDALTTQVAGLKSEIASLKAAGASETNPVNIGNVEEMQKEWSNLNNKIKDGEAQLSSMDADIQDKQVALEQISQDVSKKNDEFIEIEKLYLSKKNQTAIIEARQNGLVAEVDRLTGQVGQLEEANLRSLSVKDALVHNIDRLYIQVKEGNPLTPKKFAYADRVQAVEALRAKAAGAQWATPELQEAYSSLYLNEMQIAASQEYFFARLPLQDRYGIRGNKWAECVMKGNWAVYYRTLDGENIGVYTNIGTAEAPIWGFRDNLTPTLQKEIEQEIMNSRADDWESMVSVLAERQLSAQEDTPFQASFSSL